MEVFSILGRMNINLVPANGVARVQKLCDKDEMRQGLDRLRKNPFGRREFEKTNRRG